MKPLSIITITNNSENDIEKSLLSIVSQKNISDLELIVMDQNSNESTLSIIENYKNKLDIVVMDASSYNIYALMNIGVSLSSGKYIYFLDAGSRFTNSWILDNAISTINDAGHDALYVNANQNRKIIYDNLYARSPFNYQLAITKRELHIKYPFNESYTEAFYYDFLIKCFKEKCDFISINYPIVDSFGNKIENSFKFKIESLMILTKYFTDSSVRENIYYKDMAKEESISQKHRINELIGLNKERYHEISLIKSLTSYKVAKILLRFCRLLPFLKRGGS